MHKFACIVAFSILSFPFSARANDTAFGGSGAAPMPIKQADVVMLNEKIVITGQQINHPDMKGEWKYSCDYTFQNESDKPLSFQMGFPLPVNDELSEVTIPLGYSSKKGSALVHDFVVSVDGKTVPARRAKITAVPDKGINYEDAYIWQITMPPKKVVKLHHAYVSGVTINVMGQNYVSFVLKTGALWKGDEIGQAHFEIIPNVPTRLCTELDKNASYLKPTPAGIQIVGSGKDRKYVWDLHHFQPKEDLELCIVNNKNYVRYYIVYPIMQGLAINGTALDKVSAADLQMLRNAIYAQYGKHFDNANLQAYFDKQWWYAPNTNYSDSMLTQDDKKAIDKIQQMENKKS